MGPQKRDLFRWTLRGGTSKSACSVPAGNGVFQQESPVAEGVFETEQYCGEQEMRLCPYTYGADVKI